MKTKTLIIKDVQRDFVDPLSPSYVTGGVKLVEKIKNKIMTDIEINQVILVIQWHTLEDHSFTRNGGTKPIHCLQYSEGASIPEEILEAIQFRGFKSIDGSWNNVVTKFFLSNTYDVFTRGELPDVSEEDAFSKMKEIVEADNDLACFTDESGWSYAYLNIKSEVILCGFDLEGTKKNLQKIQVSVHEL